MKKISLYSSTGAFVTSVNAPLIALPELIQWGERFFAFDLAEDEYRECFVYIVPPSENTGANANTDTSNA